MIVLNAKGRRERPAPKPIKFPGRIPAGSIDEYLTFTCQPQQRKDIIKRLTNAQMDGVPIKWTACNLDRACTWTLMPEGPDFWGEIHHKLEKIWNA